MANNREQETKNTADDRRDATREGSSLSGSTKRNNDATDKALHPESKENASSTSGNDAPLAEGGVSARSPEREEVDQDPGERQKENQNRSKDDPLAA